eukprot:3465224-Prymnesium_polylepis.1
MTVRRPSPLVDSDAPRVDRRDWDRDCGSSRRQSGKRHHEDRVRAVRGGGMIRTTAHASGPRYILT